MLFKLSISNNHHHKKPVKTQVFRHRRDSKKISNTYHDKSVRRQASIGRKGGGRKLDPNPDQIVIAQVKNCPHCGALSAAQEQKLTAIYEKIEIPPIQPIVSRIERYGGHCSCCAQDFLAPVPLGMEQGSPFGDSVMSLVTYLRYTHAIS